MKNRLFGILQTLWPWRWMRTLWALRSGVRIHPTAVLLTSRGQLQCGRGTKIGAHARLDVGQGGRIVLGEKTWMASDVELETAAEIRIGRGTTIQRRCSINGATRVGAGCIFAPNVFVSSGTHPFRVIPHLPIREQERLIEESSGQLAEVDRPVWIQDDCWLGTNTVVCPGVTIGKGSVIGANSVVTRDIPPYSVVAGSPAREIGRRLDWQPPFAIHAANREHHVYVLSEMRSDNDEIHMARFLLSPHEPLRFVLAAPALEHGVRIHYLAPTKAEIEAGQTSYVLAAEKSILDLPPDVMQTHGDAAICQIRLISDSESMPGILKIEIQHHE